MINPFISEEMRTAYLARMEETEVPVSSRAGQVVPATPKAEVAANYLYRNTLRVTRVTRKDG